MNRDDALLPGVPEFLLAGAAALYRVGAWIHHGAHDRGWRRPTRLPVLVLSVGNLVVGGTGKTPAVLGLAGAALRAGYRPAILTRGYRRRGGPVILEAGRVARRPGAAEVTGDEPLLLSRALPTVPVLVGSDRSSMARGFLDSGAAVDLFLLDDGFQHRAVARDADLVLVDAAAPFGNGRLLPAGTLREPPRALGRATGILVTGVEGGGGIPAETARLLDGAAPGVPRAAAVVELRGFRSMVEGETLQIAPGTRVHAVAAIARPERFRRVLESAGVDIAGWSARRDHHPFTREEVEREERSAAAAGARPVTTAKDAVRLEGVIDPAAGWMVAEVTLVPEGGWDALFASLRKGNGGPQGPP